MRLPDYDGGSLANLMATIGLACGAPVTPTPLLAGLDAAELRAARSVVLLLIDGLGYRYLAREGLGTTMARHLKGAVTSVFPPTTATAITTVHTGLTPAQHGITGWHTWFRELGSVVAVLPFRSRHGGAPLSQAGVAAGSLLTGPPIFDRLDVPTSIVTHNSILDSDYNLFYSGLARRRGYQHLNQFFREVRLAAQSGRGRRFVYAYYPELDGLAHTFGPESDQVRDLFLRIDAMFEELLADLAGSDTVVLLIADHGFVQVQRTVDLCHHPELAQMLVLPLCGEPRTAYCYVDAGRERDFEVYVAERLAGDATAYPSERALAEGWFGPGIPHPRLRERIGHYCLVMQPGCVIRDAVLGEHAHVHLGAHGGVTDDEMLVPLVVAKC